MKIKIDENLQIVAKRAGKDNEIMARELAEFLMNAEMVKDEPLYYGATIAEMNENTPVSKAVSVLHQLGIENVNDETYNAFTKCVIMGDGDCPDCGGWEEEWETTGHEIKWLDRDIQPDYIIDSITYRCPMCGREHTTFYND